MCPELKKNQPGGILKEMGIEVVFIEFFLFIIKNISKKTPGFREL